MAEVLRVANLVIWAAKLYPGWFDLPISKASPTTRGGALLVCVYDPSIRGNGMNHCGTLFNDIRCLAVLLKTSFRLTWLR